MVQRRPEGVGEGSQGTEGKEKTEHDTTLLPDIAPRAEFERRAEGHFRALLDRKGARPEEWRNAVRADVAELTRSGPVPGTALDTARVRHEITTAIDAAFPRGQQS